MTNMSLSQTSTTNEVSAPTQASSSNQANADLCSQIDLDHSELDFIFENVSVMNDATDGRPSTITTIDTDGRTSSMTACTVGRPSSLDFETPQCSRNKRRAPSSDPMTDLLYELISTRKPNPVNFLQPKTKPKDHLDHFFESIASTMRTFPAISIAKLKLKISQLVGEEEVLLAQQEQLTQVVYIQTSNENNEIVQKFGTETNSNALPIDQTVQNSNNSPSKEATNNKDISN